VFRNGANLNRFLVCLTPLFLTACGGVGHLGVASGFKVGDEECAGISLEREVRGNLGRNAPHVPLGDGRHNYRCFGVHLPTSVDLVVRVESDHFRPKVFLTGEESGRPVPVAEAGASDVDDSARMQVTLRPGRYTFIVTTMDPGTGGEFRLLIYSP